jgi:shikimate dehydrogenase
MCHDADETAYAVKAASNVVFTKDRRMIALNYDGLGIVNDIKNNHNITITNKNVLVVGAGGAAKAVVAAVIKENPKSITVTNRTYEKAIAIQDMFKCDFDIQVEDFNKITKNYDLVINSTSSSIYGDLLPLSINNFKENAFAYDLMYKDDGTVFTKWCDDKHIKSADGKGMLQELSLAVFKYWRGL